MADFRQVVAQGRKRLGLLVGAGAPTSIRVADEPLIPDVAGLTRTVLDSLGDDDSEVIKSLQEDLDPTANIETILTQVRRLAQAIGSSEVHGLDGSGYDALAKAICREIGRIVGVKLPEGDTPYSQIVSWIAGTHREHPVEVFTPNYDLLLETAFEQQRVPYFDGFTGARQPFFDAVSISSSEDLPSRWSRLWKLHGSLGWDIRDEKVVRSSERDATSLIYPDHLKYDNIARQPYSALFERLRSFLATPDVLLICTGFSFSDAHICAVLDEGLASNPHSAILAFQYQPLAKEQQVVNLASKRPNLSVYARDGGVVNAVSGVWHPPESPNEDWQDIRQTFWSDDVREFTLGDFRELARFFALVRARMLSTTDNVELSDSSHSAQAASA